MEELKRLGLVVVVLPLSTMMAFSQKSNIHILATGGTIAKAGGSATSTSYTAGQIVIDILLDTVPELKNIANVIDGQIMRTGSQDMNDEVWLILAKKINQLLEHPGIDDIVITHGIDIMEEAAYFLNLIVKNDRPVVLVGVMRPSTALSADGPLNPYSAVVTAGAKESVGKGILVAMNGLILRAKSVLEMNTTNIQTFQTPSPEALGYIFSGKVFYNQAPLKKHTTQSVFGITDLGSLPRVDIVYSYSNTEADMVIPFSHHDYRGIIHVSVDNRNIHKNIFPVLAEVRKRGALVARSSRVSTGPTTLGAGVDDAQYQFIAS